MKNLIYLESDLADYCRSLSLSLVLLGCTCVVTVVCGVPGDESHRLRQMKVKLPCQGGRGPRCHGKLAVRVVRE